MASSSSSVTVVSPRNVDFRVELEYLIMGPPLLDMLLLSTYLSFFHSNFYNLYNLQRYDNAFVRFVLFSIHNFTVMIFTMLGPVRIWRIKLDADEHSSGLMSSVAINLSGIILYAMGRIWGLNESHYFDVAGVITVMLLSLYILLMIRLISPCMVSSIILPDFFAVMGLYMSLVLSEHHEASAAAGGGWYKSVLFQFVILYNIIFCVLKYDSESTVHRPAFLYSLCN